jgi:hypothetical protein
VTSRLRGFIPSVMDGRLGAVSPEA